MTLSQLVDDIKTNDANRWCHSFLVSDNGRHCDIGHIMVSNLGYTNRILKHVTLTEAIKEVSERYGVAETTVRDIVIINDESKNFKSNIRALDYYAETGELYGARLRACG